MMLAAALALLSCGGERTDREAPAAAAADPVEEPGAVFTDARRGYRLSYPSGWALTDRTGQDHMIRADISLGKTAGLQIRVLGDAAGSFEERAGRYAVSFRDDMVAHWGGTIEELDRGFRTLGANRVFHVSFHAGRRQGGEWLLVNYLVPRGNGMIAFQCGARFEDRASFEQRFEAVVASLRLTNPG